MKKLWDSARRRDVADEPACSVCRCASTVTGPVFQMNAAGGPPQGMPERIKVMLPMCPECHIRFIRFDFRCTLVSVLWCVVLLVLLALFMFGGILSLMEPCSFGFAYFMVPAAIRLYLVMPRYYRDVIGLPPVAQMVQMGYSLASRDRHGNAVESCDWAELVGDVAKHAATAGSQRLADHVHAIAPRPTRGGRGTVATLSFLAIALAVGPTIVRLVKSGFHVEQDIIFGNAIPVSGHAWIILVNFFLAFIFVPIISDCIVRSSRQMPWVREAILLLSALYVAYAFHVLDEYLYWGPDMSIYAATRGFVRRRFALFMFVFFVLTGFLSFFNFALGVKEAREARKQGRTPMLQKGGVATVFRVGLWWTLISLVLFELHIAIWFMISSFLPKTTACP